MQLRGQLRLRPRHARCANSASRRFLAAPPPSTNLVVLDPDGDVIQVVPDMDFPNGTVITPDGATLIIGETMAFRLTAFDVGRRRHA